MNLHSDYKQKFPKSQDPLDFVAKFGFEKIESLMKESIDKNQELEFTVTEHSTKFNFKTI